MPSVVAVSRAFMRSRDAMAVTFDSFPRCIAGITLTVAILATPKTPQRTVCCIERQCRTGDTEIHMDYVRLGNTGLKVSRLCLGAMTYGVKSWREWVLEEEESRPFIRKALELGINFFDTADMYSLGASEEILGRALRDFGPG